MTEAEVREFLASDPPHTGKLATTRLDGRPHVAPIWFALDTDGSIVFTTYEESLEGPHAAPRSTGRAVRRRRGATVLLRHRRGHRGDQRGPRRAPALGRGHRRPVHGCGGGRVVRRPQRRAGRAPVPPPARSHRLG